MGRVPTYVRAMTATERSKRRAIKNSYIKRIAYRIAYNVRDYLSSKDKDKDGTLRALLSELELFCLEDGPTFCPSCGTKCDDVKGDDGDDFLPPSDDCYGCPECGWSFDSWEYSNPIDWKMGLERSRRRQLEKQVSDEKKLIEDEARNNALDEFGKLSEKDNVIWH